MVVTDVAIILSRIVSVTYDTFEILSIIILRSNKK